MKALEELQEARRNLKTAEENFYRFQIHRLQLAVRKQDEFTPHKIEDIFEQVRRELGNIHMAFFVDWCKYVYPKWLKTQEEEGIDISNWVENPLDFYGKPW